jgi:integrase
LTLEECERLLKTSPPDLYPIFFTFLHTGMRKAELENLVWADVDLKRRRILIRAKETWKPKTGEREIPMSDDLHDLLSEQKKNAGDKADTEYVFPILGSGRSHNYIRTELIKIGQEAGIRELTRVHTLRHTFASHLVMQGVDLPTVGKLMGHTDIETTMIYSHLAPEHLANAVTKLPFKR